MYFGRNDFNLNNIPTSFNGKVWIQASSELHHVSFYFICIIPQRNDIFGKGGGTDRHTQILAFNIQDDLNKSIPPGAVAIFGSLSVPPTFTESIVMLWDNTYEIKRSMMQFGR